jgi:hypothetical protein
MKDTCTIWVCQDCMLHHANGECGSCHLDEGHDREPLSLLDQSKIAMGMLDEKHDCIPDWDGSRIDCGCEVINFSMSSCDGCGSTLAGERHAFTLWFDDDEHPADCMCASRCYDGPNQ